MDELSVISPTEPFFSQPRTSLLQIDLHKFHGGVLRFQGKALSDVRDMNLQHDKRPSQHDCHKHLYHVVPNQLLQLFSYTLI